MHETEARGTPWSRRVRTNVLVRRARGEEAALGIVLQCHDRILRSEATHTTHEPQLSSVSANGVRGPESGRCAHRVALEKHDRRLEARSPALLLRRGANDRGGGADMSWLLPRARRTEWRRSRWGKRGPTWARIRSVGVSAGTISCRCRFATMAPLCSMRRFCGSPLMPERGNKAARHHKLRVPSAYCCTGVCLQIPFPADRHPDHVFCDPKCRAWAGWRPWVGKRVGHPNRPRAPACPRASCPSVRRPSKRGPLHRLLQRATARRKAEPSMTTSTRSCLQEETLKGLKARAPKVRARARSAGRQRLFPLS